MSRIYLNSLNLGYGFNVTTDKPVDSRTVVEQKSDLIDSSVYVLTELHQGILINVVGDGVYSLEDKEHLVLYNLADQSVTEAQKEASYACWKKVGGGSLPTINAVDASGRKTLIPVINNQMDIYQKPVITVTGSTNIPPVYTIDLSNVTSLIDTTKPIISCPVLIKQTEQSIESTYNLDGVFADILNIDKTREQFVILYSSAVNVSGWKRTYIINKDKITYSEWERYEFHEIPVISIHVSDNVPSVYDDSDVILPATNNSDSFSRFVQIEIVNNNVSYPIYSGYFRQISIIEDSVLIRLYIVAFTENGYYEFVRTRNKADQNWTAWSYSTHIGFNYNDTTKTLTLQGTEYQITYPTIPLVLNQLLYKEQNELISDYLLTNDLFIVDSLTDFDKCASAQVSSPDILNEWVLFSDSSYSPEYGIGLSSVSGEHVGPHETTDLTDGIGYGKWSSTSSLHITNPMNSQDFTGYINPKSSSYLKYSTIIGTDKGNTTGDLCGFALVDDSHAFQRNIVCADNRTYYRNTLYDLDSTNNTNWIAWVSEDTINGTAYVIYGTQSALDGGGYQDDLPGENSSVLVYKTTRITTSAGRQNTHLWDSTTVVSSNNASGYLITLNFLITNSSGIAGIYLNSDTAAGGAEEGTVCVFTNIFPCDSTEYIPNHYFRNQSKQNYLVNIQSKCTTGSQYNYMSGEKLVSYNSQLNKNTATGNEFIRADLEYNSGVITVNFSDVVGGNDVLTQDEVNTLLDNSTIDTNFALTGNKLVIDFNNNEYSINPDLLDEETKSISEVLTKSVSVSDVNVGSTEIMNAFKGNVKFMFIALSQRNLYYKCNGFSSSDRIILRTDEDTVYQYNYITNTYNLLFDTDHNNYPKLIRDYLKGSRLSYNNITQKLFYSDGINVYPVAVNLPEQTTGSLSDKLNSLISRIEALENSNT